MSLPGMNPPAGTMTPEHERWGEFRDKLEKEISKLPGCDAEDPDKPICRGILLEMGLGVPEIEYSVAYFTVNGGHCDCEVWYNVGASLRPKPRRQRRTAGSGKRNPQIRRRR